tara:strand:+ start:109 stop:636 length:528 start_codon:yes stop_codon:yes gene_type:complete
LKKTPFLFFVLILILLDQGLKIWVFYNQDILFFPGWWWDNIPFFDVVYLENSGMAFGLLNNSGAWIKLFLSLFRVFAVFFLFYFVLKRFSSFSTFSLFVLGLLIAGACGNCIDSVFYESWGLNREGLGGGVFSGNVIDMFRVSFFPPIFNLADSFITVGCVLGLVFYKKLSGLSS